MPRFPKKESEILALAERIWRGMWNSPIYPLPPVDPMQLKLKKMTYQAKHNIFVAAKADAESAIAIKDAALEELIEAVKSNIRYAENTVNFDDEKLKLIGWSGKSDATALEPPGEVRQLEAPKQGDSWLFLDWKAPADGGKVSAYKIQRRNRPEGLWQDVATAIETESTLVDQPKGKELEYRIIGINKAGEGPPSNTAMVVL